MSNNNAAFGEAYIIEDDGTKTSIPIGFTDGKGSGPGNAHTSGPRVTFTSFGGNPYARPQQPDSMPNQGAIPKSRFKLHLGRRILGLFLVLIGLPMLILPGPGLLCILVGLSMIFTP